jgi:glycosyltransferase 2 family protein
MQPALQRALAVAAKGAITLLLLGVLFRKVDYGATLQHLRDITPLTCFLGLLILYAATALLTLRWAIILRAAGQRFAASLLFRLNVIGLLFNQALPSSIGGDGMRVWLLHKYGCPLGRAFNSVLLDRIAGFIVLVLMSLYGLPKLLQSLFNISTLETAVGIAAASAAILVLLFVLTRARPTLSRFRVGRLIAQIVTDVFFLARRLGESAKIAMLSVVSQVLTFVLIWLILRDLGTSVSFVGVAIVAPVVLLLLAVPISIAGWGLREALFMVGFGLLNVPQDVALSASILYGLLNLTAALLGGVLWILQSAHRAEAIEQAATAQTRVLQSTSRQ